MVSTTIHAQSLHEVEPRSTLQSLQVQKSCKTSYKEGMLHAATYLQLISQRHCATICKRKLHCVVAELGFTFPNGC